MTTTAADLHENIAAISESLWGGKSKFYDRHGEALSGFPGVWRFAIDAAKVFTKAEERFSKEIGQKPGTGYEYIDAVTGFGDWLRGSKELPTETDMKHAAWNYILANMWPEQERLIHSLKSPRRKANG